VIVESARHVADLVAARLPATHEPEAVSSLSRSSRSCCHEGRSLFPHSCTRQRS